MNTKTPVVLILAVAAQFEAFALPSHHASPEFPVPLQGNPFAMTQPFIVTAPRITMQDLQLKIAAGHDVQPLRYSADQALANRFQAEFKAKGFKGNVDLLSTTDTPISALPLLEIKLADWRANPGELPECSFSATLVTAKGTTWLGNFEGVSEPLSGTPSTKEQVDTLRDAATHAIDEVYRDLQARHVLSGPSQ